jgi:glycolate oxidase iron-sulfur subunit
MKNEQQKTEKRIGFRGNDIPDPTIINACVHCGLCLPVCPTYQETALEMSSPRGRINLIQAVSEGHIGIESDVFQEQMSECLNCRACEPICPSGVEYSKILETSRTQIEQSRAHALWDRAQAGQTTLAARPIWQRILRGLVFDRLFSDMGLFRSFSSLLALYQRSGLQWLARHSGLLRLLGMHEMERMLPPLSRHCIIPQGQIYPAEGQTRYTVALLTGCIMSTAFAHVHEATIRVLQKNGCTVLLPPDQTCCGALHIHDGEMQGGRELARRNIAAFEGLGIDAIIVNAAGCGSALKEYPFLLHNDTAWYERAQTFSHRVRDIQEFLVEIGIDHEALAPLPLQVTYQEPCHLAHAQRITQAPRMLLRAIPQLELHEMNESALCCGSAGIYNVVQPDMAMRLGSRKVHHALETGAEVIVTSNPGCAVQLLGELRRRGSKTQVRSVVELLDESYQRCFHIRRTR